VLFLFEDLAFPLLSAPSHPSISSLGKKNLEQSLFGTFRFLIEDVLRK
jgi:hypothetical protein